MKYTEKAGKEWVDGRQVRRQCIEYSPVCKVGGASLYSYASTNPTSTFTKYMIILVVDIIRASWATCKE
jgi:hypothetical protein